MSDLPVSFGNVCTVIDSLRTGGAERLVVTVHKYLATEIGVTPAIVTLFPGGQFEEEARAAGVRIVSLGDYSQLPVLEWVRRFRAFLAREKPGTVHGHLFPANYLLWAATLGMRRPPRVIFTEHNVHNRRRGLRPLRLIEKVIYSRFSRVICVSEEVRRSLVGWIPSAQSRMVVIRNCIEIPPVSEREWSGKTWDCVAVGSLTTQKGFENLIQTVELLRDRDVAVRIAIAGEGPLRRNLELHVQKAELARQIVLLGNVGDIRGLLEDSKIFVMPSEYEGLPMAILEAMAAGLPVVATRVGGLPEIVENGVTGYLVDRGDPGQMSIAIETLLKDEGVAQNFGRRGRRWIEAEVDVKQHLDALAEVYSRPGSITFAE